MDKKSIAFIAAHGHKVARECANTVCDNMYYMGVSKWISNSTLRVLSSYVRAFIYAYRIPEHDIYLAHGSPGLLCAVIKKKILREECKIIMRVNDSMFSDYKLKGIKKKFLRFLYKNVDGVIVISEMIKKDVEKELPNIPIEIVYCCVKDDDFFKIKPNFINKYILCLGTAPNDRKGTSIQIEVYNMFIPKKIMFIMGDIKCIQKIKNKYKNIIIKYNFLLFTGKDDPKKYLNNCLFLLHPARFDAGGNVVLEAMAAGVIPIVSYKTGNSEIVKNVDPTLIINTFKSKDYYTKLRQLFNLPTFELLILSNKCKIEAMKYTKKKMKNRFKEAFKNIIKQI